MTNEWLIPVSCMAGLVVMAALMRLLRYVERGRGE